MNATSRRTQTASTDGLSSGRAGFAWPRRVITLSPAARYAMALACALVAILVRLLLDPLWGLKLPYITLFPAIMVSAWAGGFWPGIVTTILAGSVAVYLWVGPAYSWRVANPSELLGVATFVVVGAVISALNEAWRRATVTSTAAEEDVDRARRDAETMAAQLQTALDAGKMGTWRYTPATGDVKWSAGLEAIHGYPPGGFPGTFEAFCKEVHPDDRDRVLAAIADAAQERRDHHIEYRIVRTDGSVRWVEGRGQLFMNAAHQPEWMMGVCVDVTERKQTEAELRKADERFRLVVEAAPAAMIMVDQRGRIVLINALAERMLGYSRGELVGQPVDRLVPQRFRHNHPDFRNRFFGSPQQRPMGMGRDLHALRKDGAEVPVEIGLSPIETSDGQFVLAAVTDITERKQAERALLASEAEARKQVAEITSLYQAAPSGLCVFDRNFRYVRINPALAAINGLAAEDHIGKTPFDVLPEIAGPSKQVFERVLETGAPVRFELRGGTPATAGEERVWDEQWYPLHNGDGVVVGVGVIVDDITDRKLLEERRLDLLEREKAAREELNRASRVKDEFLAVLSHELRTPLNAVLGYTHLLASGVLDPDRARHALQTIERNARAQQRLVESLLDLSRIMAGKLELDRSCLALAPVIEAALDVTRPDADAKEITVDLDMPQPDIAITGDSGRLQQIFWNLLSNAVKFTPRGGRVSVRTEIRDSAVVVDVSDNGQGISADFLPHVFDRFKQGDASRQPRAGLGLGLAVVREMVHAHGGTIVAESSGPGLGSTFRVTLPLATGAEPLLDTSDPSTDIGESLAHLDILIVDDDEDARDVLALILESRGARTRSASSAHDALDAINVRRPNVLLSDLRMPNEDGYSLIREVRGRENGVNRLPAIAVTATATLKDRERALAAGYDLHVPKPVDAANLARMIVNMTKTSGV